MTPTQRAAALRLIEFETLPRRLLDIACRVRVNECLFHDDEFVDDASHALKEAIDLLRELAAEPMQEPAIWIQSNHLQHAKNGPYLARTGPTKLMSDFIPLYAAPQQRKPLTPSMQAEVECDCLVAWNASTYGHSAQDTVHPMFLSAFLSGYRAAERAHDITGEPT